MPNEFCDTNWSIARTAIYAKNSTLLRVYEHAKHLDFSSKMTRRELHQPSSVGQGVMFFMQASKKCVGPSPMPQPHPCKHMKLTSNCNCFQITQKVETGPEVCNKIKETKQKHEAFPREALEETQHASPISPKITQTIQ